MGDKPKIMNNYTINNLFNLKNKTAVVTGGGGFLGMIFAEALLESGANVALLDIDYDALENSKTSLYKNGHEVKIFKIDITKEDNICNVIDDINNNFKTIDILVNAAALAMKDMKNSSSSYFADFEIYEKSLWGNALDVNLTGTMLMCQKVGSIMKDNKSGSIINIASDVGIISPDHRIYKPNKVTNYKGTKFNTPISYSVTKTAILGMTRYLATYWATQGIRVNSISPAGVFNKQDSEFVKELSSRIPLGRMAKPFELKGPIVFLASDASSFVTGANLVVDGGRTIW